MWQRRALWSVMVWCVAVSAFAQPSRLVVDQTNAPVADPAFTLAVGGQSDQYLAQTVTVGVPGRLWEVRLPIGCASGELVLEIRDVDAEGKPGPRVFRRLTFDAESHPALFPDVLTDEFRSLRITGRPLTFSAGDTFSIVVANTDSPTATCGVWPAGPDDDYLAGQGWFLGAFGGVRIWYPLDVGQSNATQDLPFMTVVFR